MKIDNIKKKLFFVLVIMFNKVIFFIVVALIIILNLRNNKTSISLLFLIYRLIKPHTIYYELENLNHTYRTC